QRFMRTVDRCDLEVWQIEAFAKHVDADYPVELICLEFSDDTLYVGEAMFAANECQPEARVVFIYFFKLLCAANGVGTHHDKMFQTSIPVTAELSFGRGSYGDVDGGCVFAFDRFKCDVAENMVLIGAAQIVGKHDLTLDLFLVAAEGS